MNSKFSGNPKTLNRGAQWSKKNNNRNNFKNEKPNDSSTNRNPYRRRRNRNRQARSNNKESIMTPQYTNVPKRPNLSYKPENRPNKLLNLLTKPREAELMQVPALAPTSGAIRRITKTHTLQPHVPRPGESTGTEFMIKVRPQMRNAVIKSKDNVSWELQDVLFGTVGPMAIVSTGGAHYCRGTLNYKHAAAPTTPVVFESCFDGPTDVPMWRLVANHTEFNIATTGGDAGYTWYFHLKRTDGSWDTFGPFDLAAQPTITFDGVLGFTISTSSKKSISMSMTLVHLGALYCEPLSVFDVINHMELVEQYVQTYRVVAMCALVTFTGATLDNAGVVAGARVKADWIPNLPNGGAIARPTDAINDLNVDRYSGRLENGLYAYWIPSSMDEQDFHTPVWDDPVSSLVFTGDFSGLTQSMQVQITYIVQFNSKSQLFEADKIGAITPIHEQIYDKLRESPCVFENPSHLDQIQKIISSVGRGLKSSIDFARRNPALVDAMASLLI